MGFIPNRVHIILAFLHLLILLSILLLLFFHLWRL